MPALQNAKARIGTNTMSSATAGPAAFTTAFITGPDTCSSPYATAQRRNAGRSVRGPIAGFATTIHKAISALPSAQALAKKAGLCITGIPSA